MQSIVISISAGAAGNTSAFGACALRLCGQLNNAPTIAGRSSRCQKLSAPRSPSSAAPAADGSPRAANVRAVEPASDLPSAERGSLYILLEVSGGGHAALYRQMLNAAQTAFYEKGESVEAALRQAVRSVHQVLRTANEGLPEAQWRGGASLVVRYADRVTIAQSGPGLILIGHPKTVDQFPAELGDWGPALGDAERPEIQIYDVTVESGSMILLAQSDWPQHVAAQSLAVAAAAPNVTLASQYLGQLAGSAELSALLVSFSSTIPELRDEVEPLPVAKPESKDADAGAHRRQGRHLLRPRANASSAAAARMNKPRRRRAVTSRRYSTTAVAPAVVAAAGTERTTPADGSGLRRRVGRVPFG